MTKIQTIGRISVSSFIATAALCAGSAFAQSIEDDASAAPTLFPRAAQISPRKRLGRRLRCLP
jgi:hypothetical protein